MMMVTLVMIMEMMTFIIMIMLVSDDINHSSLTIRSEKIYTYLIQNVTDE